MRLAVTGASGFLGSHVVEAAADHEVVAVVRDPARAPAGVAARAADLGDRAALAAAFAGCDAVVHAAALAVRHDPPWPEWVRANVTGVENAVHAAAAAGVRHLVLVSTVAVHRIWNPLRTVGADARTLDAVRVPWSLHFVGTRARYSRSKALGEARARAIAASRGLGLTVVRPGPLYGPRDPKLTATWLALLDRRVLPLPTVRVPHAHAGDVALACVAAAERRPGGAFFTAGDPVSPAEILERLREIAGRGPRIVRIPVPLCLRYDDGPAARVLGFRCRPLAEGLADVWARRGTP